MPGTDTEPIQSYCPKCKEALVSSPNFPVNEGEWKCVFYVEVGNKLRASGVFGSEVLNEEEVNRKTRALVSMIIRSSKKYSEVNEEA